MTKKAQLGLIALDLIQQGLDTDNREMTNDGLLLARSVIHHAHPQRRRMSIQEIACSTGIGLSLGILAMLAVHQWS